MTTQKDRIEAAIRHIQTASDVDPWAMELAVEALKAQLPSAQPEITDEQAIEHLQSTGWMQNHDREMYDMGLKKQLADDSGSYDSLLPSAQPERLTDDDFETIRIHLNAYKEKLCNQQRWKEAEEYQRIIDRFMTFASVHPNLQPTCNELATDTISRQAAVDAIDKLSDEPIGYLEAAIDALVDLPSAQPVIHCWECIYYDPEHIEKKGVRYEYEDMPKDAFDILGTGLVNSKYGINVGGRCCRDYNVGYLEDKRVFVSKQNYCGRAERRTDG